MGAIYVVRQYAGEMARYAKCLASFQEGEGALKAVVVLVAAILSYVFPTGEHQEAAAAAAILVVLDTLTGVAAAFVERRPRSSKTFARALAKTFAYLSACIVAGIAERIIFRGDTVPVLMGVLWMIIATEAVSVLENVERMGGGRFATLRRLLGRHLDQNADENGTDSSNDERR
jgi:phage-related holin